jgi:hypothetical protein
VIDTPHQRETPAKEVLSADPTAGSDSTDVVDGHSFDDPSTSGSIGVDVEMTSPELQAKPTQERGPFEGGPEPHERQDDDHIGVDWDLTVPPAHGHDG